MCVRSGGWRFACRNVLFILWVGTRPREVEPSLSDRKKHNHSNGIIFRSESSLTSGEEYMGEEEDIIYVFLGPIIRLLNKRQMDAAS